MTACNLHLFVQMQAKDAKVYMVIRVLDTHKHEWSIMSPAGNAPPQRGGHSVGASGFPTRLLQIIKQQ